MFNPSITQMVATSPFFKGLTQAEYDAVLASAHVHHVSQGEYFFHQGEDATMLYVIAEGRVKLTQVTSEGNQVILNYFGAGDGLGIIVALIDMPYPLSAEAMEACTAAAWESQTMKQIMLRIPQLALNGIEMIGQRFAWLQTRFQEVSTQRVEQRVARALLRLVRQFGRRIPEGVLIDMPLSRQDLAQMTGTNLYNVSRILSKWEQKGLISTSRMQVILCKAHELVMIAEDLAESPSPS